ncbi:hypothetical protein ScPMuIL_016314 [Solemya velum]
MLGTGVVDEQTTTPAETADVPDITSTALSSIGVGITANTFIQLPSTEPNSTTKTNAQTLVKITKDPGCGITKGCYHDCDPSAACNFLISWVNKGANVEFTIRTQTPQATEFWTSIGFSSDKTMGNTSVTECTVDSNGTVAVYQSYNFPSRKHNERLQQPTYGISSVSGSVNGEIVTCSFSRQTALTNRRRRDISVDGEHYFDLNTDWYIFHATGLLNPDGSKRHHSFKVVSPALVDFQSMNDLNQARDNVVPTNSTSSSGIPSDPECGVSKGCYHDCTSGATCTYMITWVDQPDNVDFTVTSSSARDHSSWIAIGFSSDLKMGDDGVVECTADMNGTVNVLQSYNLADPKHNQRFQTPSYGLSDITGSVVDGVIHCGFSRLKTFPTPGVRSRRAIDVLPKYYVDLTKDWYILFADGHLNNDGTKQRHSLVKLPVISPKMADFQSFEDLTGRARSPLVKTHASLMVVGWVFFACLGIIMARYFKNAWSTKTLLGQKVWFQLHRLCMVMTFLCTAMGFTLIFVEVGEYSTIGGSCFQKSHPVLGIIVMTLTVINPTMAVFRPHPGEPRRKYFNVAHMLVGISAHILAGITLAAGTTLARASVPAYTQWVVWGLCGYQVLVEIVLGSMSYYSRNLTTADRAYEMKPSAENGGTKTTEEKQTNDEDMSAGKVILGFHILILTVFAVVLLVTINTN